jgi:hypothetical protein
VKTGLNLQANYIVSLILALDSDFENPVSVKAESGGGVVGGQLEVTYDRKNGLVVTLTGNALADRVKVKASRDGVDLVEPAGVYKEAFIRRYQKDWYPEIHTDPNSPSGYGRPSDWAPMM